MTKKSNERIEILTLWTLPSFVPVDWEQLTCDMKYHKMKASAQKV